jgi:hypothetical protein
MLDIARSIQTQRASDVMTSPVVTVGPDDTARATNEELMIARRVFREQFFTLLLDRDDALAAIPKMLKSGAGDRAKALAVIREAVTAAGELDGERAERLARIEKLFGAADKAGA